MRAKRFLLLAILAGLPAATALAANPVLVAREQGVDATEAKSEELQLAELTLELDVVGALVDATLTARFSNPSDEILEGEFTFELPDGAVVTGYALDIEEQMIDGVLVEPLRATRLYEARVRRGIDPGVAKVSRANVFNTRVYPIPEKGSRSIRLRFSVPIDAVRGLEFPLVTKQAVGQFRLDVRTAALAQRPTLTLPNGLSLAWQQGRDGLTASARLAALPLSGVLRIAPVQPIQPAIETRHRNGERLVHIGDAATSTAVRGATGRRLRIYWDRSLSRRDQQLAAERALLDKYLARSQPSAIQLVIFNSSGASARGVAAADLNVALQNVEYRGATSFAVLETLQLPAAETCLIFTDGVATIDRRPDFRPGCQLFAITSADDPDFGFLRRLTAGVSGAVLQLRSQTEQQLLSRLMGAGARVIEARGEDGRDLRFTALGAGPSGWSVITESPRQGGVILRIAGLGDEVVERRYAPWAAPTRDFDAAGALWATDNVARLAAEDDSQAAFIDLSRRFSVASPGLSFLVLEDPSDYVDAGIEPPANYPARLLADYWKYRAEADEERRDAKDERLDEVLDAWEEVVDWWVTRFDPGAKKKIAQSDTPLASRVRGDASAPAAAAAPAEEMAEISDERVERVIVTGIRASLRTAEELRRDGVIGIRIAEWDVQRPYIQVLNAASAQRFKRVLAAQERKFGSLPAFYFDVAEWLHRRQRSTEAVEMLLSALDLSVANEETVFMVAERLVRYGQLDRAVWLLEREARRTDYLPQPRRSLALALAKRAASAGGAQALADTQRAIDLLNEVITTPWEGNYDGIEVVSLMELNALLPRFHALGGWQVDLDPRLRTLLDVDLRVVIEWNTGATDMDLWVDEPNGEQAMYSNQLTAIGGRLSNDMTSGYGPEEYLLRRAPTGEYRISVNVYASDMINPNGSTVVTARLFRDFGRATQREETMEIELEPDKEGAKLIGTFTVK